jgi:hypothetical protein
MNRKSQTERAALEQKKELIDEYGRLEAELVPTRAKLRRLEELGRVIRTDAAKADPEQPVTLSGNSYEIVLGAAGMQTKITDMAAAYRLLGREKFLKAASLTLKALEQHADAAAIAALTARERTGPRPLVVRSTGA